MEGCPYESADAMHAGDTFYSIDGQRIYLVSDVSAFLMRGNGVYDIVMLRNGEKVELNDFELSMKTYAEYAAFTWKTRREIIVSYKSQPTTL